MSRSARRWLFVVAAVPLAALLLAGLGGLPRAGAGRSAYGDWVAANTVGRRHVPNVVAAVVFDYRGFDTLCEEFILFAAAAGVSLLLRAPETEEASGDDGKGGESEDELPGRGAPRTSAAVRLAGATCTGAVLLFGIAMILHGYLSPGGGFQGGVIVAGAFLLVYLENDFLAYRHAIRPGLMESLEAIGVGLPPALGAAMLAGGGAFLANRLPLGHEGSLLAGGTIGVLNAASGIAVTAGITLVVLDFLERTVALREARWFR